MCFLPLLEHLREFKLSPLHLLKLLLHGQWRLPSKHYCVSSARLEENLLGVGQLAKDQCLLDLGTNVRVRSDLAHFPEILFKENWLQRRLFQCEHLRLCLLLTLHLSHTEWV